MFDRLPRVRDRRFRTEGCSSGSQSRGVRDLCERAIKGGLLWWFARGVRPCKRAIDRGL